MTAKLHKRDARIVSIAAEDTATNWIRLAMTAAQAEQLIVRLGDALAGRSDGAAQ
jgi:hypothetical protein